MLTILLALILAAPEVPPVIGPMATPLHRLTTAPALPHPDLYHGEPGMCQPRDDRPWWWTDMAPTQYGLLVMDPPTQEESLLVERMLTALPDYRAHIDPFEALALLRFEDDHGVPKDARTLLWGWRRVESGWRDGEKLYGDHGAALGALQLHEHFLSLLVLGHPATSRAEVLDATRVDWRNDLWASAYVVLQAIERQYPRALKACGEKAAYRVAEAIVARMPHAIDCSAATAHWKFADSLRGAK